MFPCKDTWQSYLNNLDCIMWTINKRKPALKEFTCVILNKYLDKRVKLLSVVNLHLSGGWLMYSGKRQNKCLKSWKVPAPAAQG
jgi:hypothetical protein